MDLAPEHHPALVTRRRVAVTAAAILALLLATLLPAAGAHAASGDGINIVPATKQLSPGQSVAASITWRVGGKPASGSVTLQHRVNGTWKNARTIKVSNGKGATTLKPGATKAYRVTAGKLVSKHKTLTVARVAASASPGDALSIVPRTKTAIKGIAVPATVTWRRAGEPASGSVTLQHQVSGKWKNARTVKVSGGKGTVSLKPGATKAYRVVAGHQTSKKKTITVRPPGTAHSLDVLTLRPATKTITKGASTAATITWHVAGSARTGTVTLQHLVSGTWKNARSVAITKGTGTTTLKPGATKAYRIVAGHQRSSKQTITVRPVVNPIPATFAVSGAGWGHGVGMSQYGAYGMALGGSSASEIVRHYYTGTAVEQQSSASIRVNLYQGTASRTVTVSGGAMRVKLGNNGAPQAVAGSTVSLAVADGQVRASAGGNQIAQGGTVVLEWENTPRYWPEGSGNVVVRVQGVSGSFRWGRLVAKVIDGRLNIVNVLRLGDEYLYGIAEMPSSWPAAALQAQAITARTYALAQGGTKANCDCTVWGDTRSQMFTGWDKQNGSFGSNWVAAVNATGTATGGQVVTHNNNLIATYYFSSSGGRTENSEDVWSAALPYLRSVVDPGSTLEANPRRSWTRTVTQATMARFFGLPDVSSVRITARYDGGAVKTMVATSSTGTTATVTAKSERFRTGLGVDSAWISAVN